MAGFTGHVHREKGVRGDGSSDEDYDMNLTAVSTAGEDHRLESTPKGRTDTP